MLLTPLIVSADRSDATETTVIIDTEDSDVEGIYSSNGKVVEVWIEAIEGMNGSSAHPIDIYIVTSDGMFDHFCGENMFAADDFTTLYTKESLSPSSLPFHFTYNVISDDSLYLLIDNCDNQKDSDYTENQDTIKVTFAIDDESDEFASAVGEAAAGLGIAFIAGIALCCGLPFLIIVVLLVRKNKTQVIIQQAQPLGSALQGFPAQQNVAYAPPPTQVTPPLQQNPPAHMQGVSDANGYEWLDYQGNKYWRQQDSKSDWTLHQ